MPQPIPFHIPTAAETDCHLVVDISKDGMLTVVDKNTQQKTMCRVGVLSVANQLTLVAVGPGSG
jgi:hypothetical protein